jgi:putative ABC transport system substrate-binding protein
MVAAFRQGMNEAGYVEGRNVAIEFRWADGQIDRLPMLARELAGRRVDVIVTSGGDAPALAAKAATAKIPIVFNSSDDPVQAGLVASLNRPGGYITGVNSLTNELMAKQFGLLRQLVPTAAVTALLVTASYPESESQIAEIEAAARTAKQPLIVLKAQTDPEIDAAFATLVQQRAGALLVVASPFFVTRMDKLITLAARLGVPAMYFRRELVHAGGLISYGTSTAEAYRQMGVYAGRILGGASPADMPVVQMTKFELVINLKTAKALGLTIPSGMMAIADEVIE